mgnify:CR=1 FL=1
MATLNMKTASEALKLFYLPGLVYQLNNASPFLAAIERDTTSVSGGEIVMALRYGRQGGVGNRADDGPLPIPNSRKTRQARWQTKNIFATIEISDKTIRASRSREGAFVSLLEAELSDALEDAKDNLARQVFGDGTGKLMTFKEHTTPTNELSVDTVQYIAEGQFIDIIDADGNTVAERREVLIVDDINNTITIDGAPVTTSDTDFAVLHLNYNQEYTGMAAVFTPDNVLYNIDRKKNKWFNPTVINLNGEISEVAIQKAIDEAERKAGGRINFMSASYGVRRAYQDTLLAVKRIVEVMQLKGGYEAITYNNIPITVDKYNPPQTLFGLDLTTWKEYQLEDFTWFDQDGAILHRDQNRPVWRATLAKYADLGCNKPRGNFIMTGIVEH